MFLKHINDLLVRELAKEKEREVKIAGLLVEANLIEKRSLEILSSLKWDETNPVKSYEDFTLGLKHHNSLLETHKVILDRINFLLKSR